MAGRSTGSGGQARVAIDLQKETLGFSGHG
jgi:hypothetical protein